MCPVDAMDLSILSRQCEAKDMTTDINRPTRITIPQKAHPVSETKLQ
jgi:hypothetical protein